MDKPMLIYIKKVEPKSHKIRLPKAIVEQWGTEYSMEIYEDRIILKPIKKGE